MADGSGAGHTRERILEAAAHEVFEHGYAGASLSSIASRLGLTKGALGYHFPTKDRILTALVERLQETLAQTDAAAVEAFPGSPSRACLAFMANVSHVASSDVITAAAMSMISDPSVPGETLFEAMRAWVRRITAYLEAMSSNEGYSFALDLTDAAEFFLATLSGTLMTARFFPRTAERPQLLFAQLAFEALGVPKADAEAIAADVLAAARNARVQMVPVESLASGRATFELALPDQEA